MRTTMAIDETPQDQPLAEQLLQSAQFKHLVQGFEKSCGLKLYAYNLASIPLDVPFDPPAFCASLQGGLDCPLYFDARYHHATTPELRPTCAGLGHVVIPVIGKDGVQIANLVTETARFGPIDMDQLTDKAFRLKVFPDDLVAQGEAVPLVPKERAMFAAQLLFAGLHELAAGEVVSARVLSLLTRHVAAAQAEDVPDAILLATLEYTEAEFAYVSLINDDHKQIADSSSLDSRDGYARILGGVAQWVIHAGDSIEIPDVSESAWCRHLAGSTPPPGAVVGVPLIAQDKVYGGLVIGGSNKSRVAEWRASMGVLQEAGSDVLLMARRLVETGGGVMIDTRTGAYNMRFLEELLEKEISRAGRHHHDLSLVLFHLANYAELVSQSGDEAAEDGLQQLVELIRSKTRKVNSLARLNETDFCLVIPEADRGVAERIAGELRALAQASSFSVDVNGGKAQIKVALKTRTVSNPRGVDSALEELVPSVN